MRNYKTSTGFIRRVAIAGQQVNVMAAGDIRYEYRNVPEDIVAELREALEARNANKIQQIVDKIQPYFVDTHL